MQVGSPVLLWLLGSVTLVVIVSAGVWWWRQRPAEVFDSDDMRALTMAGRIDEADDYIRRYLRRHPEQAEIRIALANLLISASRVDEALKLLAAGLEHDPDYRLYFLQGLIQLQRGELGPGHEINSPFVREDERAQVESADDWSRRRFERAVESLRWARELAPENPECTHALARAFDHLGRWEEAAELWEEISADPRFGAEAASRQGHDLLAMNRLEEAKVCFERALKPGPQLRLAHLGLAEIAKLRGEEKLHEEHARRAFYHGWFPPFVDIPFDEELLPWMLRLRSARPGSPVPADDEEASERGETLRSLLSKDGPLAKVLLGCALYEDRAHGELEESIAHELVHGDEQSRTLAITILQHSRFPCVIRALAWELAGVAERRVVPILIGKLPEDIDPFVVVDVAAILALLGDARAVQPLIDLLATDHRQKSLKKPRRGWTHASVRRAHQDWRGARWRAALALGRFEDDRAVDALREGIHNPDVRVPCRAALFRHTRDRMVLLPIVDQARGADPVGIQNVASFLAEIAPDYAKRLRTLPSAGQASL